MDRNVSHPSEPGSAPPRRRWAAALELLRFELAAVAVSNAWVTVWLARAWAEHWPTDLAAVPLGWALGLTALASGGLAVFGVALNDLVDARLDSAMGRPRPLAVGGVSRRAAVVFTLVSLLVGLGAASWLGRWPGLIAAGVAGCIIFYNLAGRFVPAVGLVVLGVLFATNRMVPEPALPFVWPAVLTLTHVCGCGALAHVLRGRRPRLSGRALAGLTLGWGFATLVMVVWMGRQDGLMVPGAGLLWLGPALAVAALIGVVGWMLRGGNGSHTRRHTTSARLGRLALAWLVVYDVGWLLGAQQWPAAGVAVGLLVFLWVWPRVVRG